MGGYLTHGTRTQRYVFRSYPHRPPRFLSPHEGKLSAHQVLCLNPSQDEQVQRTKPGEEECHCAGKSAAAIGKMQCQDKVRLYPCEIKTDNEV